MPETTMYETPRHKVFISYHHANEQWAKIELEKMVRFNIDKFKEEKIFEDLSVRNGDIDDTNKTDEQIRVEIRDNYMPNANVLILLCGKQTKFRKHIDWEIHTAMYDTEKNPKMGILVINMPYISQSERASTNEEKELISKYGNWIKLTSKEEFETHYPYMPDRIIDNFIDDVDISVVNWDVIKNDPDKLVELIDIAFNRKKNVKYNNSRPMRDRNYNRRW